MRDDYRRDSGRESAGLLIIIIGFALLMNSMGIFPFGEILSRFWLPGVFIGIGAWQLSRCHGRDGRYVGLFFLGFGIIILLNALNLFGPFGFRIRQLIVPGLLIFLGMRMLLRGPRERVERVRVRVDDGGHGMSASNDSSDFIDATAVLGGFHRHCSSQQFRGGDITAVMGGGKLDLRDAQMQGDQAVLDVFTLMGGMEIMVPRDWVVEQRFTPILGGYEDRTSMDNQQSAKRLSIQGVTIMGGVVVKN